MFTDGLRRGKFELAKMIIGPFYILSFDFMELKKHLEIINIDKKYSFFLIKQILNILRRKCIEKISKKPFSPNGYYLELHEKC